MFRDRIFISGFIETEDLCNTVSINRVQLGIDY